MQAKLIDPGNSSDWIRLLANGQPLVVGLAGSSTEAPGHAYVVKAVDFAVNALGISVQKLILADPWATSSTETQITWSDFQRRQLGMYLIY